MAIFRRPAPGVDRPMTGNRRMWGADLASPQPPQPGLNIPDAPPNPPRQPKGPGQDEGSYATPQPVGPVQGRNGPYPTGPEINQAINSNGFAAPQWRPETWGAAPSGWDPTKWADPNYWSPKYAIGRLQTAMDTRSPEFLQAIQRMYPGATLDKDILNLPGVGPVDIFVDEEGARLPGWMPQDQGGPGSALGSHSGSLQGALAGLLGPGGPGGAPGGAGGGSQGDLWPYIQDILGGGFNANRVDQLASAAQDRLGRFKTQTLAEDRAILADRGLAGSGAEVSALTNLDAQLGGEFSSILREIMADEGSQSSNRIIAALGSGTDLSTNELRSAVQRELGLGQLGLGYYTADQDYSLGIGNLGLGRDQLANAIRQGDMGSIIAILQVLMGQNQTNNEGYI